ncbi:hypothetical protein Vafri_6400 [Volvox africanus]|nr:hypothetical protein Vafri_6400 [Volvox africanus]
MEFRPKTSRRFVPVVWKGAQQQQRLHQRDFTTKSSSSGQKEGHIAVSETGEASLEQLISTTISHKRSLQCQAFLSPFDVDGVRVPQSVAKRRNASSASGLLPVQQQDRYPSPTASLSRADLENGDSKPFHLREIRDIQQQMKHKPQPRAPGGGLPRWSATGTGPAMAAPAVLSPNLRCSDGRPSSCSSSFQATSVDAALGGKRICTGNLDIAPQPTATDSPEHKHMLAVSFKTVTVTDQQRTSPHDSVGQCGKQGDTTLRSPHDSTATAVEPAPATAVVTVTATGAEASQATDADPAACLSMMAQSPSKGGPDLLEKMRIAETLLMHRDKLGPQLVQLVIKQLAVLCQSASVDDLVARMAKPEKGIVAASNGTAPSGSVQAPGVHPTAAGTAPVAMGAPVGNADEHGGSATSSSSSSSRTAPNGEERRPVPAVTIGSAFTTPSARPLSSGLGCAPPAAAAASLDLPPPSSQPLQPRCAIVTPMQPPKVAGSIGYGPYSSTGSHVTTTAGRSIVGRRGVDPHFFPRSHPYTHPHRIPHYHLIHQQEQHKVQAPLCTVLQEQQQVPQCGTVKAGGDYPVMTRELCRLQQQQQSQAAISPTAAVSLPADTAPTALQAQDSEQLRQGSQQQSQAAVDMTAIPKATMDMLIKAITQQAKSLISSVASGDSTNADLRGVAAAALLLQQYQQYQQQQQPQQQQQNQQQQQKLCGVSSSACGPTGGDGNAVDALPPPPARVLSRSGQLGACQDGGSDNVCVGRAASSHMVRELLHNSISDVGVSASPPLQEQQHQPVHRISPVIPKAAAPAPRRSAFILRAVGNDATGPHGSMMWGASPACGGCVSAAGTAASPDALMPPPFAPSSAASAAVSKMQLRRSTSTATPIPHQAILSGGHSRHAAAAAAATGQGWSPLMASGLSRSLSGDRSNTGVAGRPTSPDAFVTIRLSEAVMQTGVVAGKTISPPPPSPTVGMR